MFAAHSRIQQSLLLDGRLSGLDRNVLLPLATLRRRGEVSGNGLEALRVESANVIARALSVSELIEKLGLEYDQAALLPHDYEHVLLSGAMNDYLSTISKILGKSIADFKRYKHSAVPTELYDTARGY
jgi:hypothetical protein